MPHARKKRPHPFDPPRKGEGARMTAWLALGWGERRGAAPDSEAQGAQEMLGLLARQAELDPRDRALAFEIMQGVFRARRLLDAALDRVEGFAGKSVTPEILDLLRIGVYQWFYMDRVPVHALVHATVEVASARLGARKAGFCNAFLQRMVVAYPNRGADLDSLKRDLSPEERHSFPGWIVRLLSRVVGKENLENVLDVLNRPLPLYARSNPPVASPEEAVRALAREGIPARARPDLAPLCLEIEGAAGPAAATEIFRKGGLFIQDASAQLVAEMAWAALRRDSGESPAKEPPTVIDLCAAPGGKAAYLAARMEGRGRLIACDVSPARLNRLRENIARLGLENRVEVALLLPRSEGFSRDKPSLPQAGLVLVDAPCTGLGTLRRHPEIRWRLSHADLRRLAALQGAILDRAAGLVGPGGQLVYSTCSFAVEENEDVVRAFLERHPGQFEILRDAGDLPECVAARTGEDGWLRLLPGRDETDSACAVRLARIAG